MDSKSISGDPENGGDNGTREAAGVSLQSTPGLSRRSVMKAGAAAAWTVPLVQVVAAAPAMAATSGAPQLSFTSQSASASASAIAVSLTVGNNGGPTSGLTLKLTFPNGYTGTASGYNTSSWAVTRNGSTYTFTAASQIANGGTASLTATFPLKNQQAGKGINVTAVAESYAPAAATASTNLVVQ